MIWADAVPNLLIGLREGLEGGLVVSILLAALAKINESAPSSARTSPAAIWFGVLGAIAVAGSFAAVLTYSTDALSSSAQQAVGGLLSVLAVVLVTAMIFWMRRTARSLSAQLRGEVGRAATLGAGALTVTAFLAVGREGLETALFLWTAIKASGSTVAPLVGAGLGLAAAVVLCWLLYRRAVRINLGTFFNRTAVALIIVAAGVLSYGLGDLQDAGWLPGGRWVAVDLGTQLDPTSWWVSVVSGLTELTPRLTVLQVVAWLGYVATVTTLFITARAPAPPPPVPTSAPAPSAGERWTRRAARRPWAVAAALTLTPAAVAGAVIGVLPTPSASATAAVSVTRSSCAPEWTAGHTGSQTFEVANRSGQAGEVDLLDASGAVVAEVETIGPATTAAMSASLGRGQYRFSCLMANGSTQGEMVTVTGRNTHTTVAAKRVTLGELAGPNGRYETYAAGRLVRLAADVTSLRAALARDDRPLARTRWLAAQLDWERVGASYDSFGDAGAAVDGLPDGLPGGVHDPHFAGLHRIEYGLYHGEATSALVPVATRLARDVAVVARNLRSDDEAGDPTNLPLRVHEILEDAQRDHVSGIDDQGSGTAYAATWADTQVTLVVLDEVAPLLASRAPGLVADAERRVATLQTALLLTRRDGVWQPRSAVRLAVRQRIDAALGAALETLSAEPPVLEIPPTH